jgi:primosomal protein N' (replication factor Y)
VIIVDEFHDDSYYQAEIPPYYHARQLAVMYAHLAGAVCVLGSATPDVESRYRAAVGEWQYLGLPARILAHKQTVQNQLQKLAAERQEGAVASHYRPLEADAETIELPSVRIIDMREELKAGNRSIFSRALQQALTEVLQHREQAILFLNRRGSATYVFCRDCGYALKCPRCEIPLTLHTDAAQREMQTEALICHRCGYRRKMVQSCPQCKGTRVRHFGVGTERVEEEIRSLYPQARPLRWDFETTREKGAHDLILNRFSSHQADILVGTQMVAKGLDLPLVTLVGVVLAEVGLNLPDLRAAERTFQVLTQVAGRAGRSPLGGQVILQTFQPEQYAIQAAAGHDYDSFYRQELQARRSMGYPPFARLVRLEYRHLRAEQAEAVAHKLAAQLQAWIEEERSGATEIIGPAPCFYARLGGQYRWQIVLRGPDPAALLRGRIPEGWRIETNPPSLL